MEVVMLTQDINSLFSSLGCPIGEEYIVGDDCLTTLQEILTRLNKEDKYVRGFRRLIANSQVIKKDLLPLFYNVKDDQKILDLIIEILENLMTPVECLFPIDLLIKEDAGRSTICQLNWLLTACKEAFLKPCATKCVINYMKLLTRKGQHLTPEMCHSVNLCLLLLRNLLHIPEVRGGAPGPGASHQNQIIWNLFTQHIDKVLIQLLTEDTGSVWSVSIVQLISLLYKDQQSNTIYKLLSTWCDNALSESSEDDESNTSPQDQGSGDSSSMVTSDPTSDSSDSDHQKDKKTSEPDTKFHQHQPHPKPSAQIRMNEIFPNGVGRKAQVAMRNKHGVSAKNTHNHSAKHRQFDFIHQMECHTVIKGSKVCLSSESGLGSSDAGSFSAGSMKMECNSVELDDDQSAENQESISTSSTEDKEPTRFGKRKPIHQKPPNMIHKSRYINGKALLTSQDRKDLRRKILAKRSRTATMSIKTFLNHTPSEEDISNLLVEFTIDFLLKGYGSLVTELKRIILTNKDVQMDPSYFTWLLMFFLRFSTQLELDLDLIRPVCSVDIIAYLTYEGVNLCEELEVAKLQVGQNLIKTLRKLYLVVATFKEIIQTVESYKKFTHLTQEDRKYVRELQEKISRMSDLKHLFVLLLRHFDPTVQSHQYLQDLIVTNHNLLILTENCPLIPKSTITEHIKQFASEDVMKQYGVLLACFKENGEVVNNCIFTMMHHVAGDLEKVSVLFQPSILRSFTRILETNFKISDDWSDLLEYVLQKCLKTKQIKVEPEASLHFVDDYEMKPLEATPIEALSAPVEDTFSEWNAEESENLCWYFPQCMEMDDPIGHINQLFLENSGQGKKRIDIIENLFKQGLIQENQYRCFLEKEPSPLPETIRSSTKEMDILQGVNVITEYLQNQNCGYFIKWLQNCLLEVCYARLILDGHRKPQYDLVEPVAYFYTMLKKPVPLVTWTQDLWRVMQLEPLIWLLSALNFHLPTRAGQAKIFARIPAEWSADHLYVTALVLGPLDSSSVKFDPSVLHVMKQCGLPSSSHTRSTNTKGCLQTNSSLFGFFVGSSTSADWLSKVKQLKSSSKLQPLGEKHERMSLSGDERDWDLISMCVSDEGARQEWNSVPRLENAVPQL